MVTFFYELSKRAWTGLSRILFKIFSPEKIGYTKYVLTTFSNGIKLCAIGVDVEATYYKRTNDFGRS